METLILNAALMISITAIVLGIIIHLRYPNTVHKKTLYILAVSFSVIAMSVNPTKYWDIYRQYELLDAIRISKIGFFDFLFNNEMRIGGSDYVSLLSYNVIRYAVVILGKNRLLPFIMTFITYAIWSYITVDWNKKNKMSGNDIIISMLLSGVLIPFIFVNSGLRNTTAAAIAALAIYNNLYKKHRTRELIALFFVAFTIHYSVIYVIIVYVLARLCSVKIASIALFIWTNVVPVVATQFKNSPYEVLRKMASSFTLYTGKRGLGGNLYLWGVYVVLFALIVSLALMSKNRGIEDNLGIKKFFILMIMNALFNLGYTQVTLRPLYTLGVMSSPVLYYMYGGEYRENKNQQILAIMSIFVGLAFVLRVSLPEYFVITYC